MAAVDPDSDKERDERMRSDFAPHERATLREMMERFLRGKWVKEVLRGFILWATAVLVLVGLFRDQIGTVIAMVTGGGGTP